MEAEYVDCRRHGFRPALWLMGVTRVNSQLHDRQRVAN